jgi:hypothetical protein
MQRLPTFEAAVQQTCVPRREAAAVPLNNQHLFWNAAALNI